MPAFSVSPIVRATGRFVPALAVLALLSCGGSGSPNDAGDGESAPYEESGHIAYDGSFFAPLGDFRITDLRTGTAEADGDTVDPYASKENFETRTLEVFHQTGLVDRPVVFFIHGGGWTDGYLDWYRFVAESFTGEMGYVTVVIDYRLTSESVFPAAICSTRTSDAPDPALKAAWYPDDIRDCVDAFRWTLDHAADYGGDPEKVFVFGHSAGGHLAALLATHDEYGSLRSHIRGLVGMSGAYLLKELSMTAFADILDQTFGTHTDEAVLDEASPSTYVSELSSFPPCLLLYAEDDLPSFVTQTVSFATRLSAAGFDVEAEYLSGYGHVSEMQSIDSSYEAPTARIIRFIEEQTE